MAKNDRQRFDVTERGGRYSVGGKLVDANGKPVQQATASETDSGEPALEDYTVDELREIADQQDIDLEGATRKADIIDRIRAASSTES